MRRGLRIIQDSRELERVGPDMFDGYLRRGWRNHGPRFFRYNMAIMQGRMHLVLPLRIDLEEWRPSRSQRRVIRDNANLGCRTGPARIDGERRALFRLHAERFPLETRPAELEEFIGPRPWDTPCRGIEIAMFDEAKLAACSYGFLGSDSFSSIYAAFDPAGSGRSLGILTMLEEMRWARAQGLKWYYPGYATYHRSLYDYKKEFHALQYYDWEHRWHPMPRGGFADQDEAPRVADLRNAGRS